ncbi:DUF1993 domain-containing protein [Aquabacterium lacunae]|uniref:DUF1993 domain-containing protein n=2 Tax=Aquabacterium lacunae TaxID=2528630 RepID=A0A4V6MTR2_9BURK|nr:DUF1993 domain-containing protein [Aquabacterium lacunae]
MYQAFVPGVSNTLQALSQVLAKGAAHCEARKIDPSAFLQSRLFPDMFPLVKQVQIACDMAKGGVARLAGFDNPKFDDNETTFAELQVRIERTLAFIRSVSPEQIDGSEGKVITLTLPSRTLEFTGQQYLTTFVIPNVYFHATTAYNLLRQGGVEVGKRDFLGG